MKLPKNIDWEIWKVVEDSGIKVQFVEPPEVVRQSIFRNMYIAFLQEAMGIMLRHKGLL